MINLFFVPWDFSGAGTYRKEVVAYLATCPNIKVFVVNIVGNLSEIKETTNNSITEITIPMPRAKHYKKEKFLSLCATLLQSKYSHLENNVFHFNSHLLVDLAQSVKSKFDCKIVYSLHFLLPQFTCVKFDDSYKCNLDNDDDKMLLNILTLADQIICVTKFAEETIHKHFNITSHKTHTILNGFNNASINNSNKQKLKKQFGFDTTEKIVLYAGQLEFRKGIDTLLKAFKEVLIEFPKTRLVIAGNGNFNDYMKYNKGIYGKVQFTGRVDLEDIRKFYLMADVGVIPSRFEQCSYVAIEMMHYAVPIVVTDVPGMTELFDHEQNALKCRLVMHNNGEEIVLNPDETELADQIKRLIREPDFAKQLGQNAQKKARREFTTEVMGKETFKIYQKVIKNEGLALSENENLNSKPFRVEGPSLKIEAVEV